MTEAQSLVEHARVSPEVAHIIILAAKRFHVRLKDLRGSSKVQKLVEARQWAVVRARSLTTTSTDYRHQGRPSYWEIGRALNRDHSTIMHAERQARSGAVRTYRGAPCIGRKG